MWINSAERPRSSAVLVGAVVIGLAALTPLSLAAAGQASDDQPSSTTTENSKGPSLFPEPRILAKGIRWIEEFGRDEGGLPNDGFYPELGHMINPGTSLTRQPGFLDADLAVAFDDRNHVSYPTRGGLYRGVYATYRDRSAGELTFNRWEIEAAQFIPVARERGVIAVRWWTVLSDTGVGRNVPFYMLPSLGGHNTLRGFADYRFHDRHLLVVNAESRWALLPHVDGAVFVDAGNVAARAKDLDLARTSCGFGFRLHTNKTTLARFDVARSVEGCRFLLKLTDPLRIGRIDRRTAVVPFVP